MLEIRPITLRDTNAYVAKYHRHNKPTNGHKWSVACYDGDRLCGVAIAGQPVARKLDDGLTIEIRRVCTDGTRNACSILVKPRVSLRPYRTFQEVEQPESEFLLRLDKDEGVGLFEADGGMWKLRARETVKAFLEAQLAEEVSSGAVIVAL